MSISTGRVYGIFAVFGLAACGPAEGMDSTEPEVIGTVEEAWSELSCVNATTGSMTLPNWPCGTSQLFVDTYNAWVPYGSPSCPDQFSIDVFGHENRYWSPTSWMINWPTSQLECQLSGWLTTLYTRGHGIGVWGVQKKVKYHGEWIGGQCWPVLDPNNSAFPVYPPNSFAAVKVSGAAYMVTGPTSYVQRPIHFEINHKCIPW